VSPRHFFFLTVHLKKKKNGWIEEGLKHKIPKLQIFKFW